MNQLALNRTKELARVATTSLILVVFTAMVLRLGMAPSSVQSDSNDSPSVKIALSRR